MTNNKTWDAALYIRLSQEDDDNNEEKVESNSVTNQKNMLTEYINEHSEIRMFDTYIDDGFTGTDFNRPGFLRMVHDMKSSLINCIIVKDLSRLGRNYIEVGNYLEQIFPLYNIRFISINDNIDSYQSPSSINTIIVPFKNLINDEYARDTSIKIRSSLNTKKKKGEFVGAFTSYGYLKDEKNKHKLIVDKEAANVVRKIFDLKVNSGLGNAAISNRLNELGILNPTGHKRVELKQKYANNGLIDNNYSWTASTVRKILKNEIYIGNTVQGKRRTKSYKMHQVEDVPKEEWIKVENTHEAIIDEETFKKAQIQIKNKLKSSPKTKKVSTWAGLIKCADCKKTMTKKSSTNAKGKTYEYYICSTYKNKSKKLCTKHTIKVDNLEQKVIKEVNKLIKNSIYLNKKISEILFNNIENEKRKELIENNIKRKQNEREKKIEFIKYLYEDWKNQDITKEEYIDLKSKYKKDIEIIEKNLELMKTEKVNLEEDLRDMKRKKNEFIKNKKIYNISRKLALELIKYIYVHESGNITVSFNERYIEK